MLRYPPHLHMGDGFGAGSSGTTGGVKIARMASMSGGKAAAAEPAVITGLRGAAPALGGFAVPAQGAGVGSGFDSVCFILIPQECVAGRRAARLKGNIVHPGAEVKGKLPTFRKYLLAP